MVYEIQNLIKTYNKRVILNIPYLKIPHNNITCILGPTGSGKTTLLKILSNIIRADKGTIKFLNSFYNTDAAYDTQIRKNVVMVFQKPLMFDGSVVDNITLGLKIKKMKICKQKINKILEDFDIIHIAQHNAKMCSGGEKQKIAIARALITEPKILILDEPTSHLDSQSTQSIAQIIKNYYHTNQSSTCIIVSTHDILFALNLTNDIKQIQNTNIVDVSKENMLNKVFTFLQSKL